MKLQQLLFGSMIGISALFGASNSTRADVILSFGQSANSNTVTATNPSSSSTSIQGSNIGIGVTEISPSSGLSTPFSAFLTFSLNSTGAASTGGGIFAQQYSGSFSITSGLNGTGTNYLSDASITGYVTGQTQNPTTLSFFSNDPSGFTSGVIPGLGGPTGVSFSLGNITGLPSSGGNTNSLNGNGTVNAFGGSISGNFSGTSTPSSSTPVVPEPSFMGMLSVSAIGWGSWLFRRRRLLNVAV